MFISYHTWSLVCNCLMLLLKVKGGNVGVYVGRVINSWLVSVKKTFFLDLFLIFPIQGYYAYVHSGAGSWFADAILRSPNMTKTGSGCVVRFYYHMYTASSSAFTGSLYLKLKIQGATSTLYEVSSNQGNKWKLAEVGLGALDAGKSFGSKSLSSVCSGNCLNSSKSS